jgi:hypothetical protein
MYPLLINILNMYHFLRNHRNITHRSYSKAYYTKHIAKLNSDVSLQFSNLLVKLDDSHLKFVAFLFELFLSKNLNKLNKLPDPPLHTTQPTLPITQPTLTTKPLPIVSPVYRNDNNEHALIKDLLLLMQGINGKHIRLFDTAPKVLDLSLSAQQTAMLNHISMTGVYYVKIRDLLSKLKKKNSVLLNSLVSYISQDLNQFHRLLSVLENHLTSPTSLTLRKLFIWVQEPLQKLSVTFTLLTSISNSNEHIITLLERYTTHGDPLISEYMKNILQTVQQPYLDMITAWVTKGLLQNGQEFFVQELDNDQGWDHYTLVNDQVPNIIDKATAKKIYVTGKNVAYLISNKVEFDLKVESITDTNLEQVIEKLYLHSSMLAMSHLQPNLLSCLKEIKDTMLLCRGDFSSFLIESLHPYLSLPAQHIYRHSIVIHLENALRLIGGSGNIDCLIMEANQGDLGYDVFTLEYTKPSLLFIDFEPYKQLFWGVWKCVQAEFFAGLLVEKPDNEGRWLGTSTENSEEIEKSKRMFGMEIRHFIRIYKSFLFMVHYPLPINSSLDY